MKLTTIKAGKGDAFILEWGEENQFKMLIDGGTPGTYRELKNYLSTSNNLSSIIVTHVDYDHIGGIIKLIKNNQTLHNYKLFINTPELIIYDSESSLVDFKHGDILIKLLKEKNIDFKSIFLPRDTIIEIEGLKLTILSPTIEILNKLKEDWDAYRLKDYLDEQNDLEGQVSNDTKLTKSVKQILSEKDELKSWKSDTINASSIAFIAEWKEQKILFLGDSNPEIITKRLLELNYSESNLLEVDQVKVSHHGSKHNTSRKFLSLIKTSRFIFSTNQAGPNCHPDRETIIKIAHYTNRSKERLEFLFNYQIDTEKFISEDEKKYYKIDFGEA